MKIRVTTKSYEYMGLLKESSHEVEKTASNAHGKVYYYFTSNGREWGLDGAECEIVGEEKKGPIKSDGGSSSYYDLELSDSLLNSLIERKNDGKCYVKTEELISVLFDNDYDFGCAFKALVRAKQNLEGVGKAGNDLRYETNKVKYYADKIFEQGEIGE